MSFPHCQILGIFPYFLHNHSYALQDVYFSLPNFAKYFVNQTPTLYF